MSAALHSALIVFAKAPVAGQVKTRLIPALGPAGAAALAARLLQHTVNKAMATGLAHVELCTAPDRSHAAFAALAAQHRLRLSEQGDGDLGVRMNRALNRQLDLQRRVLLIGTDAPALDVATLHLAAQALLDHDAVFVPAFDGGYALVGLSRPAPGLFEGMVWSTSQVMQATRERARQAKLSWVELPAVADIDEPADLVHLPADWAR